MESKEKLYFDQYLKQITIQYFSVTTSDGIDIQLIVYKPKSLNSDNAPAYVYAHGGGAFAFEAKHFNTIMSVSCINLNCVIISVDFRNGPDVKCPRGQMDFMESINFVIDNPK